MQETPILSNKWYTAKKPTFLVRILELIAQEGEISKTKASRKLKAYYADISHRFRALENANIILYSSSRPTGRKPEKCYKLSKKGLEIFIDESSNPEECWIAIAWFCILHKNENVIVNDFEKYYGLLEKKYSANLSVTGGHFQLDVFDKIFKGFLNDKEDDYITNAQMVLECLALNRLITLEEIFQKIREKQEEFFQEDFIDILSLSNLQQDERSPSVDKIKAVLDRYGSTESYYVNNQTKLTSHDPEELLEAYVNYLSHAMIVPTNNHSCQGGAGTQYELSLMGVTLVIALIRSVYVENEDQAQKYLYYDLSLTDYYNKIAANYQDKLPMIFRKWKEIGNELFFDILVYLDSRRLFTQIPFYMGGNKELYDGIKGAASYANDKYYEIYQSGLAALKKLDYLDSNKKEKYIPVIKKKLREIESVLKYTDLQLLAADLDNIRKSGQKDLGSFTPSLEAIEKIFAEELTLLLYLARRTTVFISTLNPSMFVDYPYRDKHNSLITQSHELQLLAFEDNEIKIWLSEKIRDSWVYQRGALGETSMLYKELTKQELS